MAESSDSCGVCAHLLSCAFCSSRDWDAGDERGRPSENLIREANN